MPRTLDYATPALNRHPPRTLGKLGWQVAVIQTLLWTLWLFASLLGNPPSRGQNWCDRIAGDLMNGGFAFAAFGLTASLIALTAAIRPITKRRPWHRAYFACIAVWLFLIPLSAHERSVSLSDYLYPHGPSMEPLQRCATVVILQPVAVVLTARAVIGAVSRTVVR